MASSIDTLGRLNSAATTKIYSPLENDGTIRVIKIHPGPYSTKKIVCSLVLRKPTDTWEYHALSYVWGTQENPREITLEGETFYVTSSLHGALLRLQDDDAEKLVWIDALAINQADILERNQQVPRMRDIYSGAKTTIAWLGEGDNEVNGIFDLLASCWLKFPQGGSINDEAINNEFSTMIAGIPQASADWTKGAVEDYSGANITLLPYWQRVWVVQETMFAKIVILIYGPYFIPYKVFKHLWKLLTHCLEPELQPVDGERSPLQPFYPELTCGPDNLQGEQVITLDEWQHVYSFLRECSDPRDVVFGFHGCFSPEVRQKISVDYNRPTYLVYAEVVRIIIGVTDNLDILLRVDNFIQSSGFPSWLPYFARSGAHGTLTFTFESRNGKGNDTHLDKVEDTRQIDLLTPENTQSQESSSVFSITDLERVLHVRGLKIGIVVAQAPTVSFDLGTSTHDLYEHLYRVMSSLGAGQSSRVDAFLASVLHPQARKLKGILKLLRNALEFGEFGILGHPVVKSFLTRLPKAMQAILRGLLARHTNRAMFTMSRNFLDSGDADPSEDLVLDFGLGPRGVKSGDLVYLIRGCSYPIITRLADSDGRLVWVGSADMPEHDNRDSTLEQDPSRYPSWDGEWKDLEFC